MLSTVKGIGRGISNRPGSHKPPRLFCSARTPTRPAAAGPRFAEGRWNDQARTFLRTLT